MSFAKVVGLARLVSISDQLAVFWKVFSQAFIDHGGDSQDVDAIIKDASNDRKLLNDFVKKVIGGVWNFAEVLMDTCYEYTDESEPRLFREWALACFPDWVIPENVGEDWCSKWMGTPPKGDCKYKLLHFGRPVSYNEIREANLGNKTEWAGFRELLFYAAHLQSKGFRLERYTIVAPGSLRASCAMRARDDWEVGKTFPTASDDEEGFNFGWHGVHDGNEDRKEYGTNNFFLVRVYE